MTGGSVSTDLNAVIIAAVMKLVTSVEFDVNGAAGKGGHDGLTSNATIPAAGELRVIISRMGAP